MTDSTSTATDPTPAPIPTQLPLLLVQFPEDSQWVRLGAGAKTPKAGVPWRRVPTTYPELRNHVDGGGNGGVVPASAAWREGIRLAVLDVDRGDAGALTAAYRPVALAETRRGSHAWYLSNDPPACNATWSGPGGTGGEYRGLNGYAALHGDELATVDAGLGRIGRGCGRGDLPIHLLNIAGHRKGERAARRVLVNVAAALTRFEAALPGATPHTLKGAAVGTRHPALVLAMSRWGGRRQWNGRPIDESWLAGRCAAYFLGMPDRRTFGEVEAAGILAWVLSARRRWLARPHRPEFIDLQRERGGMGGRPSLFGRAMSATERKRRQRADVTKANGSPVGGLILRRGRSSSASSTDCHRLAHSARAALRGGKRPCNGSN